MDPYPQIAKITWKILDPDMSRGQAYALLLAVQIASPDRDKFHDSTAQL